MSTEIDFKSLWNKQPAGDIPDTKELFAKADKLKRKTRNCLIKSNVVLLFVAIFVGCVGFNIDHENLTTKIGIALIITAIVFYLIAYNQTLPLLFKTNPQSSSHDYLEQLISIKRKQEFLNTVMVNIYFVLLSTGLCLYMLQFGMKLSESGAIFYYAVTFAWIAIAWFYLRPRGVKKQAKPLNELIAKLEEVNKQLDSNSEKEQ